MLVPKYFCTAGHMRPLPNGWLLPAEMYMSHTRLYQINDHQWVSRYLLTNHFIIWEDEDDDSNP
jgi:hypothetical protein